MTTASLKQRAMASYLARRVDDASSADGLKDAVLCVDEAVRAGFVTSRQARGLRDRARARWLGAAEFRQVSPYPPF